MHAAEGKTSWSTRLPFQKLEGLGADDRLGLAEFDQGVRFRAVAFAHWPGFSCLGFFGVSAGCFAVGDRSADSSDPAGFFSSFSDAELMQ